MQKQEKEEATLQALGTTAVAAKPSDKTVRATFLRIS
eukprot:CAMPEP_0176447170 /NCGR_PEP_ID=MMETSP0127-20121128/24845_1 /TAXON_ID=938130 /ORGANISM="Platyophrya macrostoma, Strain WH" /LENGTH=36 /DNA_ID= /DNA_START= /DNA_END= /DNA_ORIENTATION=